ncbi:hypothetical protein G7085_15275 [Tessaracoccus sp. HDW20]|nr:hypothetical protein [Tessaracoccus coleopterorum]
MAEVPLGQARACSDPAIYAGATPVQLAADGEPTPLPFALPTEHGFALVCVAVPGRETEAARLVFSIDGEAPTAGPELAVQEMGDGTVMVDPLFDIPDIADLQVLFGPSMRRTAPTGTRTSSTAGSRSSSRRRSFRPASARSASTWQATSPGDRPGSRRLTAPTATQTRGTDTGAEGRVGICGRGHIAER